MDVKWILLGSLVLMWALIFFSPSKSNASVNIPVLDNLPEPDTKAVLSESLKINGVTLMVLGDPNIDEIFYKKDTGEFKDEVLNLTSGKVILGTKKGLKDLQIDTVVLQLDGTFISENIEINLVSGTIRGKFYSESLRIDGTNINLYDCEITAQNVLIESITLGGNIFIDPKSKITIKISATRGTLEIRIPKGKRELLEVSGSNYKVKEL